jgi:hypothetical protein
MAGGLGPDHRQRKQSGRILAWSAVLFVCLQGGLGLAMHTTLPQWRDPRLAFHQESLARHQAASGPGVRTVLVLGSSRVVHGVHARAMERELTTLLNCPVVVGNSAYLGGGPFRSLRTWRQMRHRAAPDVVVLEVMPPWLNGNHPLIETGEELFPAGELYADDVELIQRYTGSRPWLRAEWLCSLAVPAHDCRYAFLSLSVPRLLPWEYRREKPAEDDFSRECSADLRSQAVANACKTYGPYLAGYTVGGPGWQALCEHVHLLHREQVRCILLLMPEGPIFQSLYPTGAWASLCSALEELARSAGAEVVDARDWFVCEEDLSDSHHLIPAAGRAFSLRLAREHLLDRLRGTSEPAALTH